PRRRNRAARVRARGRAPNLEPMTASAIAAIVAAFLSVLAAASIVYLLVRARAATRTFEQEIERAKARFDDIVAHEIEQRGIELEQALKIARAEALSAHVEEERRITEERRRDVAERERDASA